MKKRLEEDKMKILVIPSFYPTEENPYRGIFFREQSEIIQSFGCEVHVVYSEHLSLKRFSFNKAYKNHFQYSHNIENGLPVHRKHTWNFIPTMNRYGLGLKIWVRHVLKIIKLIMSEGFVPDVIHAHGLVAAGIAAFEVKKKYKIPYIITEHFSGFEQKTFNNNASFKTLKESLLNAEKIIAVSPSLRNSIIKTFNLENENELLVIPNFIDVNFFSLKKENKKNNFSFLTISNLTYNKKVDRLIEAFSFLCKDKNNIFLRIGGDGESLDSLKQLVSRLNIQDKVIFLGNLSRSEVKDQMMASDCFVLSSDIETFGVVLLEALAVGTPVISTRSGGPDFFINDDIGRLVEKNSKSLYDAMCYMIDNISKFERNKVRDFVVKNFSGDVIALKYLDMFKNIITEKFKP